MKKQNATSVANVAALIEMGRGDTAIDNAVRTCTLSGIKNLIIKDGSRGPEDYAGLEVMKKFAARPGATIKYLKKHQGVLDVLDHRTTVLLEIPPNCIATAHETRDLIIGFVFSFRVASFLRENQKKQGAAFREKQARVQTICDGANVRVASALDQRVCAAFSHFPLVAGHICGVPSAPTDLSACNGPGARGRLHALSVRAEPSRGKGAVQFWTRRCALYPASRSSRHVQFSLHCAPREHVAQKMDAAPHLLCVAGGALLGDATRMALFFAAQFPRRALVHVVAHANCRVGSASLARLVLHQRVLFQSRVLARVSPSRVRAFVPHSHDLRQDWLDRI